MIDDRSTPQRGSSGGWLVVWTEPRAEKKVAARIATRNIEAWLPTRRERHRWSDRWREVVLPLFPGYLFVRAGAAEVGTLVRIPGVLTVVKTGTRPALLSDAFIRTLRLAVDEHGVTSIPVSACPDYRVEEELVVREGPLAGLRGVVRQLKGSKYLVLWIAQIGRGVALTIDASHVTRRTAAGAPSF